MRLGLLRSVVAWSLLFVSPLFAADVLQYGSPADVEMSTKALQSGIALFEASVEADTLRGAVILVARRGTIVVHKTLGWRNKETRQPMERDTLFRMASNTKPVIGTATMILVDDGQLSLDHELGRYMPEFNSVKYSSVKVRHLLSHTSGLRVPGLFFQPLLDPPDPSTGLTQLQWEVRRFANIGPEETPGSSFRYNNVGYNILGALIETRSTQPLETFLHERIYKPLGMNDTAHRHDPARSERMAVGYERNKAGEWRIRFAQDTPLKVPFVRASGGMISTAHDHAVFCQMMLNRGEYGGTRILAKHSAKDAMSAQTRELYTKAELKMRTSFYGFGWHVGVDGTCWHGGSEGTFAWIDPSRQVVGLVLTQSPGGVIPIDEFRDAVNAACEETAP